MNSVVCEGVHFYYGDNHAVRDLNLAIPKGSIFALIGPNGSGKSTTLNMITTLLEPQSGVVRVNDLDTVEQADQVRANLGLAPEEPAVFSGLTAFEFVNLSAVLHGISEADAEEKSRELLTRFELIDKADHQLGSFSKGMKRKALIASALVHDPELLILDEPLDGLDIFAQKLLREYLKERSERGLTLIYSTHILETVEGFCSHVGLLENGKLLDHGPIGEVKARLKIQNLGDAFSAANRKVT